MEKFSYQKKFNLQADIVRFGNADDVKINYGVFVGEPNSEGNNPKEHAQKNNAALEVTDDEIYQCIEDSVNSF